MSTLQSLTFTVCPQDQGQHRRTGVGQCVTQPPWAEQLRPGEPLAGYGQDGG